MRRGTGAPADLAEATYDAAVARFRRHPAEAVRLADRRRRERWEAELTSDVRVRMGGGLWAWLLTLVLKYAIRAMVERLVELYLRDRTLLMAGG